MMSLNEHSETDMVDTVYLPIEGTNCPRARDLQTGDLLFPRAPLATKGIFSKLFEYFKFNVSDSEKIYQPADDLGTKTIRQIVESTDSPTTTLTWNISDTKKKPKKWNSTTAETTDTGEDSGFDYPEFMRTVYPILQSQFKDILDEWLDMTLDDFIKSKFGKFLINAIDTKDTRQNFFIGHVGIVIRTGDRDEDVYVVDENITDFAHYRVAIHPYLCSQSSTPMDQYGQGAIGWANFHCAQDHLEGGRRIWRAILTREITDEEEETIARTAKEHLGRPYGFFDNAHFGDNDRMYCAELVHKIYQSIGVNLTDRMTWGWMQNYLNRDGTKLQKAAISEVIEKRHKNINDSFFLLHPAALWCSTSLEPVFSPTTPSEPYVLPVP
jgi:Permuted papain-like amidase enzyme, YaeF/YiiX, C92 family